MVDADINPPRCHPLCVLGGPWHENIWSWWNYSCTCDTASAGWEAERRPDWDVAKDFKPNTFCANRLKKLVFTWPRLAVSSHHQSSRLFPGYIEQMFYLHYRQGFNELTNITLQSVRKALVVSNNVTRRQCWKRWGGKRNPNKKVTVYPFI